MTQPDPEVRVQLERAHSEALVVSLGRESIEPGSDLGYVADLGPELLLLLRISEGMRFNGFSVIRIEDISELDVPHEHDEFVEEALRLRDESVEAAPEIDLSDFEAAIRSAGRIFELVTLHSERTNPDVCEIGKIRSVTSEVVTLAGIDPDADWDDELSEIATADVTRMDVGGAYEEALLLVGGPSPARHLQSV